MAPRALVRLVCLVLSTTLFVSAATRSTRGVAAEGAAPATPRSASAEQSATSGTSGQVRAILSKHCFKCHGKGSIAESDVFVLDYDKLVAGGEIKPGRPSFKLLRVIEEGEMPKDKDIPPGNHLSSDEIDVLHRWAVAGAPSYAVAVKPQSRPFLTDAALFADIVRDLNAQAPENRQYLRYYSLAPLYNAGAAVVSDEELDGYRLAMGKLLNSLSWQRDIARPEPINATKTLLRIDLRDLRWSADTWKAILAAYPYAVTTPNSADVSRLSATPLPVVRADWFVAEASAGALYYTILDLPATVAELERKLDVDATRDINENRVIRSGLRAGHSGVSKNNRVVERHASSFGAYWKSFDFSNNVGPQDVFANPLSLQPAGGEMIFNLPNGMQAYYIANGQGRRLDVAPTTIVFDHAPVAGQEPEVRAAVSCMYCHFTGMRSAKDEVRPMLDTPAFSASFDVVRARNLYPGQQSIDRVLTQDERRFRAAVEDAGGRVGGTVDSEPISSLARRHRVPLAPSQAAAEVGLPVEIFRQQLLSHKALLDLGLGQLVAENGSIARDTWDEHFGDVVRELQLGAYIKATARPRTDVVAVPPSAPTPPPSAAEPALLAPIRKMIETGTEGFRSIRGSGKRSFDGTEYTTFYPVSIDVPGFSECNVQSSRTGGMGLYCDAYSGSSESTAMDAYRKLAAELSAVARSLGTTTREEAKHDDTHIKKDRLETRFTASNRTSIEVWFTKRTYKSGTVEHTVELWVVPP
jgi:hypothetical protein